MGLAPIRTRVTASRLDDFGFDHSPPARNRTLTGRLSGDCTTLVLQAGMRATRAKTWNTNELGQTAGFEPATSRSVVDNPHSTARFAGKERARVLALSLAELRLS